MKNKIEELARRAKEELEGNILPFWMERVVDHEQGGFYGHIDYNGVVHPMANKGAVLNARILWTFSAAARQLGGEKYIQSAGRAYEYVTRYFVDKEFGGVFWELDYQGKPVGTKKQIYAIAFAIYGLVEYFRLTGEKEALQLAKSLYSDIEEHSFDHDRNGYFEAFTREWAPIDDLRLSERDQNENKTMNTHLHILEAYTNLFRVWKDEGLRGQLKNLVELFMDKFINERHHLNLFFDDDWTLKSDFISFGHDIECSWLLQEAAEVLDDRDLVNRSKVLAVEIARENMTGLDTDGGLCYEYFPVRDEFDHDKHWWPQAEAVVGYYNAYEVSGEDQFLEAAYRSWEFIEQYIVDRENGEWHWSVNREGVPYENEEKAGFWKCPYHNSRACLEVLSRAAEYSCI